MSKPKRLDAHPLGKYDDVGVVRDEPETPAARAVAELDPVAQAALDAAPRRRGRKQTHGRLAQPGMAQVNVTIPAALRAQLKRHCEDATIAAQAVDPEAGPVTMSAVIEHLVAAYLEGTKPKP